MTATIVFLILATAFLAYTNGANDNFKGVATLFGSDTTDYRHAIWWATVTTLAGSVASIFLAATLLGFPISTTHALTGALTGAGILAVGGGFNFTALGARFFLPLLISPFLALVIASTVYLIMRHLRQAAGITEEWCVCIGAEPELVPLRIPTGDLATSDGQALSTVSSPRITLASGETCQRRYGGSVLGISAQSLLDGAHFLSAGVVSFARGLNDTPKIVALLVAAQAMGLRWGMGMVGLAMAVGGLLGARRVAEMMSKRITPLNHGQGFTANAVTGGLVIGASMLGHPVSTTHVSVGSLIGIGTATREGNLRVISQILLSWLLTLPIGALLAAGIYAIAR
jgi:PiT family inorganic phosphate transporter